MNCMKDNTKWFWEQSKQQKYINVPTCTILHPCLDVMEVTEAKKNPKSVCNINQAHKALQRTTTCITDYDHNFFLDKINRRENIEYNRDMSADTNEY